MLNKSSRVLEFDRCARIDSYARLETRTRVFVHSPPPTTALAAHVRARLRARVLAPEPPSVNRRRVVRPRASMASLGGALSRETRSFRRFDWTRSSRSSRLRRLDALDGVAASSFSSSSGSPSVYLIGAGPGGVDSLTLGAARALAACDVVVHDDLGGSSSSVLALATKPGVEFLSVGKRGGSAASWTQRDICALLVELVAGGRVVARLKGGCPSTFARVSEEIAALRAARISYVMIPGVSSALSAPLSVGIPLTDRELGRHYSVTSAHDPKSIDFAAFSGIDTCVFLMVGKTLPIVVDALMRDAAKSPETPCCVIRNGMQPDERSWFGSLSDICEQTAGESLSPCVLVVGAVVTLA